VEIVDGGLVILSSSAYYIRAKQIIKLLYVK